MPLTGDIKKNSSLFVAQKSKKLARQYLKKKNFGRAFSHYLVALMLEPNWKVNLKEEFILSLCNNTLLIYIKYNYSNFMNKYI